MDSFDAEQRSYSALFCAMSVLYTARFKTIAHPHLGLLKTSECITTPSPSVETIGPPSVH